MLETAEKYPIEYDEDSPKLTTEQLAQFKPVHFNSMEERGLAMRKGHATVSDTGVSE